MELTNGCYSEGPKFGTYSDGGFWDSLLLINILHIIIAKGIPRGYQGLFTPMSLGYPLSVFYKNSTLKKKGIHCQGE